MLTYITLENFKSIQNQEIKLAKINLFIGPNRAGKSTISQAIALLKQSEHMIKWDGNILHLKDFQNTLCKKHTIPKISIQFGGFFSQYKLSKLIGTSRTAYGIQVGIDSDGLSEIGYKLEGGPLKISNTISRKSTPGIPRIEINGVRFEFRQGLQFNRFLQTAGYSKIEPQSEIDDYLIGRAVDEFTETIDKQLSFCRFIPTTRGFDKSIYPLLDGITEIPSSLGVTKQSETAVSNMAYDHKIKDRITSLIQRVIPDSNIDVRNIPPHQVQVVNKDRFGEYPITDEGFGLNQLIYLFQQLVMGENGSTYFIDEPEIALHPASQFDLCSALLHISQTEDKQLIMTTHSEHMLLGFLELIMMKKLSSTDLKVYSFEKPEGITKITELKANENGELEGEPKGFFAVDMAHIDRFIQSIKDKNDS